MNYSRYLKHLLKIVILLIGVAIVEPFLTMAVILELGPLIYRFGRTGIIIMMLIEITGVPLFLIAVFVGVLGGAWLRGRAINGLVLSLILYLYWFPFKLFSHPQRIGLITFASLIGFPVVGAVGMLIYAAVAKRMNARAACSCPDNSELI